jgi:phosphopantetheine adenylyltransferase
MSSEADGIRQITYPYNQSICCIDHTVVSWETEERAMKYTRERERTLYVRKCAVHRRGTGARYSTQTIQPYLERTHAKMRCLHMDVDFRR